MPKQMSYDLEDCLRRPNPYVEIVTEISQPDVGQVLRRPDQFTTTPPLVAGSIIGGISGAPAGGVEMAPGTATLAAFAGEQSFYDLNKEDPQRRKKGLSWDVDKNFVRGVLRSFTARVQRVALAGFYFPIDFQLEIIRVTKTPGVRQTLNAGTQQYTNTVFTEYTFASVLSSPAVIKAANIVWDGAQKTTLSFDLSAYGVVLENLNANAPAPDQTGDLPRYYFILTGLNLPNTNGLWRWLVDTASARTVANVGTFTRAFWGRNDDQSQWVVDPPFTDVPACSIVIDSYPVQSKATYDIDLGAAPDPLAGGRMVFERLLPAGTSALTEISTNGGGLYTAIKHGDAIAVAQQTYKLRITMNSDAAQRSSPAVTALGIEFRIPVDVSVESIPELPTREIATPILQANIPESKLRVLRTGIRDYLDVATTIASKKPTTRLEADIFLASRHPAVTRDKWLRLERLTVSNRVPDEVSENFTLLSYASKLKRKIPAKRETINTVHKVTSADAALGWIRVTPALPGVGVSDNTAYDAKGYYIRVRTTASAGIPLNFQAVVQGNTGPNQLDFVGGVLPAQLQVNDVIELHSGIVAIAPIRIVDMDPADAWDLVVNAAGIPPERVGLGYLPRGGKPPRVTDRSPGDVATQNKCKVTLDLKEEEPADELLDQLSFIMGGVWLEIDGQICYVQIHPLRGLDGTITVPLPPPVGVLDLRDYAGLQCPPGLEERSTFVTAKYGVNSTAANPDAYLERVTAVGDNDAFAWLQRQDMDDVASSEIPDKVSRWLYNSTDQGLYLATVVAGMLVRAQSTGKRIFPFNAVEAQPQLLPGDSLVIVTDKYTDYDPTNQIELRGPLAIRGVLVHVGPLGHQLAIYVLGLSENVTKLSGGSPGDMGGVGGADVLYDFLNVEPYSETPTTKTYRATVGVLVTEVWLGYDTFPLPAVDARFDRVRGRMSPLLTPIDGNRQMFITLPKPPEKFIVSAQLEPRGADLRVGHPVQLDVYASPDQAPIVELDDIELPTLVTQWIRIRERGIAVTSVLLRTQVGKEPISALGAPTRSAPAASVVRGGLLSDVGAAGSRIFEIEQDCQRDTVRNAYIDGEAHLSNGQVMALGPFVFDWDTNPNILSVDVTGTIVKILCDTDTKSIRVFDSLGTWEYVLDGLSATINVGQMGTNGVAGLGAGATSTFTIQARSEPTAYVDVGTLIVTRDVVISDTGAPPAAAAWDTPGLTAQAPAVGSGNMTFHLKATAAPAGWTVKVWGGINNNPSLDITGAVAPALSAPPTVDTVYTFNSGYIAVHDPPRTLRVYAIKAELYDNLGVLKDTRQVQANWYSSP